MFIDMLHLLLLTMLFAFVLFVQIVLEVKKQMSASRVFVVTGGNKGIGKSIVKLLLQESEEKTVYLTSRNAKNGQKAVNDLEELGLKPRFHQLDITDEMSIETLRDYLAEKYGGLDVLVNNAGMAYKTASTASMLEKAEVTNNCNFFGTLQVCDTLFPFLKQNGRVVHLSSMASEYGFKKLSPELKKQFSDPGLKIAGLKELMTKYIADTREDKVAKNGWPVDSAYSMSKVGLSFLAMLHQKVFDTETPQRNIIVNACCPGAVDTDMTAGRYPNMLTPDQGADTPTFLALIPVDEKEPKGSYFKSKKVVRFPPFK